MIIQIGPVIVALLAVPLFGERLHAWLLGRHGGRLRRRRGHRPRLLGRRRGVSLVGVRLVLVAAAMYAVGVLSQKVLLRRLPSVQVVFVSFLIGALICLPFATTSSGVVAERRRRAVVDRLPRASSRPPSPSRPGPTRSPTPTPAALSLTTFLVPGITTLIAWLLIDEVPPTLTFVGGALAIVGVLMTRRTPKPRGREQA